MADRTSISWTDATWNPLAGCSRVSEGCRNCYAEGMAARFNKPGQWGEGLATMVRTPDGKSAPRWTGEVRFNEGALDQPLRWRKRRRIFVNSTSDLFHEAVPDEWIDKVFAVMALSPRHTFQVLTKRPERMREYLDWPDMPYRVASTALTVGRNLPDGHPGWSPNRWKYSPTLGHTRARWPLPNVWLGVSVEDQVTADVRIPYLLATPAAVRFISAEPLLGPLDIASWLAPVSTPGHCVSIDGDWWHAPGSCPNCRPPLDWVIVGGESGPRARPMHPDWVRKIRDQCAEAAVPFHFKQWGEWVPQVGAVDGWQIADDPEISRFDHVDWEEDGSLSERYRPMWCDDRADDTMSRIGRKPAGRHLDGVEHLAFPGDRA